MLVKNVRKHSGFSIVTGRLITKQCFCNLHVLTKLSYLEQQAPLSQRDNSTCYVSTFVLFHKVWDLERSQTAKVTFKVIDNGAI